MVHAGSLAAGDASGLFVASGSPTPATGSGPYSPRALSGSAERFENQELRISKRAGVADVAEALDCAPGTAVEHLRKAEAAILERFELCFATAGSPSRDRSDELRSGAGETTERAVVTEPFPLPGDDPIPTTL